MPFFLYIFIVMSINISCSTELSMKKSFITSGSGLESFLKVKVTLNLRGKGKFASC